jgi:hypothetical protein
MISAKIGWVACRDPSPPIRHDFTHRSPTRRLLSAPRCRSAGRGSGVAQRRSNMGERSSGRACDAPMDTAARTARYPGVPLRAHRAYVVYLRVSQINNCAYCLDMRMRHKGPMSIDAGTEERRVSGTLSPMPRRIAQLPSLPIPDVPKQGDVHHAIAPPIDLFGGVWDVGGFVDSAGF